NSGDWVYAGTGLTDGTAVTGLVGYEADRYDNTFPPPNSISGTYFLLSHSAWGTGQYQFANSSVYQAPSGAWVFAAGTMSWSWALDNFGHNLADARNHQTTANILNAFGPGAPVVHDLKVTAPAPVTAGQPFMVSVIAENAQGNSVASYSGTVHFSSSDASTGVVLPA